MDERQELIEKLKKIEFHADNPWELADFILADRLRVVEPLVKWKELYSKPDYWGSSIDPINETLRNAGVK